MVPCLYEYDETEFDTNGLGKLADAITCYVTEERNGSYELEMTYPITGIHADEITEERIILAKANETSQTQPFRIYKISTPIDGIITVCGRHVSYQLNYIPVTPPVSATGCENALAALVNASLGGGAFTFYTNNESLVAYSVDTPDSLRNYLGGVSGSILDVYGGEYEWDRFDVKLWTARGADNGVRIVYGKNLTDFKHEINVDEVITGVYPFWVSEDGETYLELSEQVVAATEINSNLERIMVLDCSGEFDEEPTEAELREYAVSYLEDCSYVEPSIDITVSFLNLQGLPGYEDIAEAENVSLCDTVHVYVPKLGIEVSSKVTKTKYNTLLERYDSITLSNSTVGAKNSSLVSTISEAKKVATEISKYTAGYATTSYVKSAIETSETGILQTVAEGYATTAYVEQEIAGIDFDVGGRNLLLNSTGNRGDTTNWKNSSGDLLIDSDGYNNHNALAFDSDVSSSSGSFYQNIAAQISDMEAGDEITLTFWYYVSSEKNFSKANALNLTLSYTYEDDDGITRTVMETIWNTATYFSNYDTWTRVSTTLTLPYAGMTGYTLSFGRTTIVDAKWSCIKVEKGNVATDWTPAPEDMENLLSEYYSTTSEVKSLIEQTSDEILQTVTSSYTTTTEMKSLISTATSVEVAVSYAVSTSGTTVPDDDAWQTSIPSVSAGQYLWIRTVTTYGDGTVNTAYSVAYSGNDGTSISIKGTAYTEEEEEDYVVGSNHLIYSDESLETQVTDAELGDTYIVNGCLFVYSGSGDYFYYAGEMKGDAGVGIASITPYYAAGTSATTAPSTPSVSTWVLDQTSLMLTTKSYVWCAYLMIYTDATAVWTEPFVLSDVTTRDILTTYYSTTEATQSMIDEAVDSITLSVSSTYATQAALTAQTVHYGTCATDASTAAKVVECSDFSGLYAGASINVNFAHANTASNPTLNVNGTGAKTIYAYGSALASDSEYNWAANSVVSFVYDGTYWRLVDSGSLSLITTTTATLSAAITVNANAITSEVSRATTAETNLGAVDTKYGTCATAAATATKVVSCSGFSSASLVAGTTIVVYFTYANTAATPKLNVNSTGAKTIHAYGSSIVSGSDYNWVAKSSVTFVYDGTYWVMVDGGANSKIVQLADSITLSVTGGSLGSTASITISANGEEVDSVDLNLSGVRTAFKNDTTAITISAGTVSFTSNTFIVSSTYFSVTASGVITATSGTIGGWTIGSTGIYKYSATTSGTASTQYGVYLNTNSPSNTTMGIIIRQRSFDGSSYGSWVNNFYVRYDGYVYAKSGTIGGWTLSSTKLYGGSSSTGVACMQIPSSSITWVFAAGGTSHSSYSDCPFRVSKAGKMYAEDAVISGEVTATSGYYSAVLSAGSLTFQYGTNTAVALRAFNAAGWLKVDGKLAFSNGSSILFATSSNSSVYDPSITYTTSDYLSLNGGSGVRITSTLYASGVVPKTTNYYSLGNSSYKWQYIYAVNSTIQTSDRNQKHDIQQISDQYMDFFYRLSGVSYVMNGGDRTHIGAIAQDVYAAMEESGLSAEDFGGFCRDEKTSYREFDSEGSGIESTKYVVTDDSGNPVYDYGLRYAEFIFLCVEAIQRQKKEIDILKETVAKLAAAS